MENHRLQSIQMIKLFRISIHLFSLSKNHNIQLHAKDTLLKMIDRIFDQLEIQLDIRPEPEYSDDFFKDIVLEILDEVYYQDHQKNNILLR
jgi:hypothetical protein